MTDVVICGAKRTPMGGFQGELSSLAAPDLGATAIRGALDEAGADGAAVCAHEPMGTRTESSCAIKRAAWRLILPGLPPALW